MTIRQEKKLIRDMQRMKAEMSLLKGITLRGKKDESEKIKELKKMILKIK